MQHEASIFQRCTTVEYYNMSNNEAWLIAFPVQMIQDMINDNLHPRDSRTISQPCPDGSTNLILSR